MNIFGGVDEECEIHFWRSTSENRFFGIIKNIRKIKISCPITNLTENNLTKPNPTKFY